MLNKGCIHFKIIMSFKYSTKNVQVIVVKNFCRAAFLLGTKKDLCDHQTFSDLLFRLVVFGEYLTVYFYFKSTVLL